MPVTINDYFYKVVVVIVIAAAAAAIDVDAIQGAQALMALTKRASRSQNTGRPIYAKMKPFEL